MAELAAALDRNVMPGGPGYSGGMPQLADGGCVSDLNSMSGTSDTAHELSDWEWGSFSPAGRDFSASNPVSQVTDVATPTLLLHGEDDLRCPVGQAEQWHVALRELGVDTQLVRYPGPRLPGRARA